MKQTNLVIAILAVAMLSVMSVSLASAAIAYVTPTASQYIPSGLFYVNVTYAASDIAAVTNFSLGNSSIFFNEVMFSTYNGNKGCDATNCWAQIISDDTSIQEGTYALKVSLGNESNKWYANKSQTVTIDRTNPSLDIKESSVTQTEPINYKCSDTNIDSFTVAHTNSAGTTVTENLQKSTSDYVQYTTTVPGNYVFTCTDLAGNSATETIAAGTPEGYAIPPMATTQQELFWQNLLKNKILWIIVAGAVILFLMNKK